MAAMFSSCDPTGDSTPTLSASPSEVTFSAEGDTKNVAVTCSEGDWTFAGQPSWLTVTKNGDELQMTAEANDENSERTGTVTLSAGKSEFIIDVKQEKASKYPGYKELTVAEASYTGTLYQSLIPDCEGGLANISLVSADERTRVAIEFFTEAFATVDEVELTAGTYTKGDDFADMSTFTLEGTPGTFIAGGSYVISDEDGDEDFVGGTRVEYTTGDATENTFCTAGSFTITLNEDGTYLIKTDLKDADGKDLKYYYEGAIEIDTEGAMFPAGEETILSAMYSDNGITTADTRLFSLTLMTSSYNMMIFEICQTKSSSDAIDLSGTYTVTTADTWDYAAGSMNKGSLITIEEEGEVYTMGSGSYLTFGFVNTYPVAGGTLSLTKGEDGTYGVDINVTDSDGTAHIYEYENVLIMDGNSSEDEGEYID